MFWSRSTRHFTMDFNGQQSSLQCVVPSCKQKREPGISFHKLPDKKTDSKRYRKWLHALKLKYAPSIFAKVCSKHFSAFDFHPIRLSEQNKLVLKDHVLPKVVELPVNLKQQEKIKARDERTKVRAERKKETTEVKAEENNMNESLFAFLDPPTPSSQDNSVQVDTLDLDQLFLKKKRNVIQIKTNEQLTAWTGLHQLKLLDVLVQAVEMVPEVSMLAKWDITTRNLLLLTFIKLKTDLSFRCISTLFDISQKTASKYFREFIPILADVARIAVPWPCKEMVKNDLPYHFSDYENVRAVLDCTEIPIQRSNCLHCRVLTYSHYKGRETAKYMVSVTPGGCFSYISPGYVGKASDKFIFNASGMVSLFEENDAVMVDKGFAIMKELLENNLELVRPPMLFDTQLSGDEAKENVSIAGAHVHVERGIQRIKIFNILKKLDTSLLYLLDDIMIVLAGITNLSAPILADDKFLVGKN